MIDQTYDRIARLLAFNPAGKAFESVPWDDLHEHLREKLPFYLRFSVNPGKFILIVALLTLPFSVLAPSRSVAAFAAGLVTAILVSWYRAWKQSDAWELSNVTATKLVHESEEVEFQALIHNKGNTLIEVVVIRVLFEGSIERERFVLLNGLRPGEKRRFKIAYLADRGMGHYAFEDVKVVNIDPLGFAALCLSVPCRLDVEVLPDEIPVDEIEVRTAGLTMHSGAFELGAAGDSVSFLGLREWQHGDSIRHIDWKRSQRQGELLVKTFERMCATDATILFDQRVESHVEFGGISSLETLRDSANSIMRQLLRQQLRVQFRSSTHAIPFGGGSIHENLLTQVVMQQELCKGKSIRELISSNVADIPPDSMLILMVCSMGTVWDEIWEQLLVLNDQRVDIILVVVDSGAFEKRVADAANLNARQLEVLDFIKAAQPSMHSTSDLDRLIRKISERTWVLGPHMTIGSVMHQFGDVQSRKSIR